jgi:hypothetical protein
VAGRLTVRLKLAKDPEVGRSSIKIKIQCLRWCSNLNRRVVLAVIDLGHGNHGAGLASFGDGLVREVCWWNESILGVNPKKLVCRLWQCSESRVSLDMVFEPLLCILAVVERRCKDKTEEKGVHRQSLDGIHLGPALDANLKNESEIKRL